MHHRPRSAAACLVVMAANAPRTPKQHPTTISQHRRPHRAAMDAVTPTIPARKQAFLTAQTNLLSQPLAPSRGWQGTNDASDTPIPRRLVDDAVFNLNHAIEQHCRRVYAPQATRNLAEQISAIYIKQMDRREGGANDVDGGVGKEVDLSESE